MTVVIDVVIRPFGNSHQENHYPSLDTVSELTTSDVRFVSIESIRVNQKKLKKLSWAKIRAYAQAYDSGEEFPPLSVLDCGDGFFTVQDGRHRFQAQLACGYQTVEVLVAN